MAEGFWNTPPPALKRFPALVFFIVNICAPGIGTMAVGVIESFDWNMICLGIVQAITSFIIVGWIWSIVWGYNLYMNSTGDVSEERQSLVENIA